MQSIEITKNEFRNIIQDQLNITNPVLLKSGVLGVLADYLTNIKYDIANYYNSLFREMNPSLARDFNSMLFHSSLYDTQLQFAKAAVFDISIIIPEIAIKNVEFLEFSIPENFKFRDDNNIDFMIMDRIDIKQSETQVTAFMYTNTAKKQLLVTLAPDPTKPGKNIYLVHYNNVKQMSRSYKKIVVPSYTIGDTFKFNLNVSNYQNIKSITSWLNVHTNNNIQTVLMDKYSPSEIINVFKVQKMTNKFFKFKSNRLSLDLFLNIFDTSVSFETGNGRIGKHLNTNDEILICIEETLGKKGNFNNLSFILPDVQTTIHSKSGLVDLTKYPLNGVSIDGGKNGKNIQTVDAMKQEIFNKISYRKSLTSVNDFEIFFETNGIRPFIDNKFLNGRNFVYAYNVLETKIQNNSVVLDSYSINLDESTIAANPFYPVLHRYGKDLVSPFYYKFLNTNETEMYIVNPKIYIDLVADVMNTSIDSLVFSLNYNFDTNKSSFVLDQGAIDNLSYHFETDDFSFTLDYANNFTWEVNSLFTDEFCIIKSPINTIKLKVKNQNDVIISRFANTTETYQLISAQYAFKYYRKNVAAAIPQIVDLSAISLGYLSNELRNILGQADKILHPYSNEETSVLLKLPFVEKTFSTLDFTTQYDILNDFFKIQEAKGLINFNTRVFQCFYNTLELDQKYNKAVYKKNANVSQNLNKKISINIYIDKNYFDISTTFKTLNELRLNLELDVINFFQTKRGFQMRYFESELENLIYTKYNTDSDYPYIKNIDILEPSLFIVNDSDTIYYNIKDQLTFDELIDFCPPFFQFDLKDININITF